MSRGGSRIGRRLRHRRDLQWQQRLAARRRRSSSSPQRRHQRPAPVGTATTNAPAAPSGGTLTTEQIVERVGPAVVTVINRQKYTAVAPPATRRATPSRREHDQPIDTGLGSGVIYDKAGYILTNNHVVEGATAIDVELADGSRVDATLVGRDPSNDVAVVKIDPSKVAAVAELGDSSAVKPGQRVVAIGSPEALENSVTEGIVSGINRQIDTYVGLIQTDAAINHGNSGGPLINAFGQVIGLNTLGVRDNNAQGLNFAIPINKAKQVAGDARQQGQRRRRLHPRLPRRAGGPAEHRQGGAVRHEGDAGGICRYGRIRHPGGESGPEAGRRDYRRQWHETGQ